MHIHALRPTSAIANILHYRSLEGAARWLRRQGIAPVRRGRIHLWPLDEVEHAIASQTRVTSTPIPEPRPEAQP